MKKIIFLLLTFIMCISLCSCSNSRLSKEEMLENSQELSIDDMANTIKDNIINARNKYEGNTYKITGFITTINEDCVIINEFITAYLSQEDLIQISNNQKVDIVGTIENIDSKQVDTTLGGTSTTGTKITLEMKNSYLVNDVYEINGVMNCRKNYKYVEGYTINYDWYCKIKAEDGEEYHLEDYIPEEDQHFNNTVNGLGEHAMVASDYGKGTATILGETFTHLDKVTVSGNVYYEINGAKTEYNMKPVSISKNN